MAGTYRSGSATNLRAADNSTYQVNSATGRTAWYGRISGVPNSLRSLSVTYTGSNSSSCAQALAVYNASYGTWSSLGTRTVGPTPATIAVTLGGTLANYVSGTTGNGDVLVRVQCMSLSAAAYYTSGDLLKVTYGS